MQRKSNSRSRILNFGKICSQRTSKERQILFLNKTDMENTFQNQCTNLFKDLTEEESIEIKASILALQFLVLVDEKMKEKGLTKKELADQIGTSVSYLTQLFRGDRKPSWEILTKISLALGLEFKVTLNQ